MPELTKLQKGKVKSGTNLEVEKVLLQEVIHFYTIHILELHQKIQIQLHLNDITSTQMLLFTK